MFTPVFTGVEGWLSLLLSKQKRRSMATISHRSRLFQLVGRSDDKDLQSPCFLWVLFFPHKTTGKPISSLKLVAQFKASRNRKIKVHGKWTQDYACDKKRVIFSLSFPSLQLAVQRTTESSFLYKTMVLALDKTWQLKGKITARFILLIELEGTLWSWNPPLLDVQIMPFLQSNFIKQEEGKLMSSDIAILSICKVDTVLGFSQVSHLILLYLGSRPNTSYRFVIYVQNASFKVNDMRMYLTFFPSL